MAWAAYSAEFYSPTTVTLVQSTQFYAATNLVQGPGVGFDAADPHNAIGGGAGATWVTDGSGGDYYTAPIGPTPILRFDLGSDVILSEISTWGYSNGNSNGARDFTLRFATQADGTGGFGTTVTYNPTFIAAFSATTRDSHAFAQAVTARYVEMTITDNYGGQPGAPPGGDRVGLGEVAFQAAWESAQPASIGHIWAQLSATANINFANAILVWDTIDKGTAAPGDWSSSTVIGAVNAGSLVAPATPLSANTAYVARFYGIDGAGAEAWSAPISFSSHIAPFYDSTASLAQSTQYYAVVNLGQGEAVGFGAAGPYNQLGASNASFSWVTNDSGADYYAAPVGPTPIIHFDLGGDVLLREISTWGYSSGNANGAKDFSLRFATDAEGTAGFGSSITYNPTFIADRLFSPRDHHSFSEFVTARYVEMTITDNYRSVPGAGLGGDRVGLGEVAFGASGVIGWTNENQPSRGNTWANVTALLNTDVASAMLLWDTTDQGPTAPPGAWANSLALGPLSAGQAIAQAASLAPSTSYTARFYAVSGAEQGWSEPISFTTSAAPFYNSTPTLVQSTEYFPAANIAQGEGAGFSATAPYNQTGATWVTNNSGADYFAPSPLGPTPIFTFDLGSDVLLSEISTWGYSDGNVNGAKDFSLRFATSAEGTGNFGNSISYNPTFIANQSFATRDSNAFEGYVLARYVEMTMTDNYFGFGAGGDRVGLGEVAFEQIAQPAGAVLWYNHSHVQTRPSEAILRATVNRDLVTTILVWDTSDKGTGSTGDWANSVALGPQSAGEISQAISGILQHSTYTWRYFGVDAAATQGWSDAATFSNSFFYPGTTATLVQSSEFFPLSRLVQGIGVGIDSNPPYNRLGGDFTDTWVTNASGGDYYAAPGPTPIIVFDLGEDVLLSEISTWGYSNSNANGAKDFSLRFATDAEGTGGFGSSIAYNPTFIADRLTAPRDSHRFSEWVTARYVEMTITDNYTGVPGAGPGGDRVGLGEVAFERTFQATVIRLR